MYTFPKRSVYTFATRSLYTFSTRSAYTVSMDTFSRVVCGTLDDRVIRMPMLMAMRQMSLVLTIVGGLGNVCRPDGYIAGTSTGPTVTFWVNPKTAGIRDRTDKITARLAAPADLHRPVS